MHILLFAALFFVLLVLAHPEKDMARSVGISISELNEVRSADGVINFEHLGVITRRSISYVQALSAVLVTGLFSYIH
jgi:hypothetical protein